MKVKNVSPVGDLEVALSGGYQLVKYGDVIDVSDVVGASLCEQPTNWTPVKETKE